MFKQKARGEKKGTPGTIFCCVRGRGTVHCGTAGVSVGRTFLTGNVSETFGNFGIGGNARSYLFK